MTPTLKAKKTLTAIFLLLAFALIITATPALSKYIGPFEVYTGDDNGNPVSTYNPGDIMRLWIYNHGGTTTVEVTARILDPSGNPITSFHGTRVVSGNAKVEVFQWQIPENAPTGKYTVTFTLKYGGEQVTDSIFFNVASPAPVSPTQPSKGGISTTLLLIIIVVIVVVVVGALAVYMARRKPEAVLEEAAIPTQPPPPIPGISQRSEEGTVVIGGAQPGTPITTGGGATLTALAKLIAKNGKVIPIVSLRQRFGREDFRGIVPDDQLRLISRRSKPQFEMYFDNARKAWFIVDNASANGTYVNGEDIRGKGPVELKPGDTINPAGVIDLVFQP